MGTLVIHGEGLSKRYRRGAPQPNLSGRIPELDGLRGFAILMVLLFHYGYRPGDPGSALLIHFRNLFRLGWTGVDLFFVLSGFLIGGILLDAKGSPNYFKTFYARRFYRIIPIYYLYILSFILLVVFAGKVLQAHNHAHELPTLGVGVLEQFLFVQNIWAHSSVIALWWFGVTWSLAVEEQFYLATPLVIRFLDGARLRALLLLIIFSAPLLRAYFYFTEQPLAPHGYVFTPCRADSLALGMLAAIYWRDERFRSWLSTRRRSLFVLVTVLFAGMAALWRWYSNPLLFLPLTIGLSWIGLSYAALLLLTLQNRGGLIARTARTNWLRELGRVSYCVYLIHNVIPYLVFVLALRSTPHLVDLRTFGLMLVSAALTYLIARLSWRLIEGPLVKIGHRWSYESAAASAQVAFTPAASDEGGRAFYS
jgi:peptidoglycan/LPS O-acetylase OafA/YrhL